VEGEGLGAFDGVYVQEVKPQDRRPPEGCRGFRQGPQRGNQEDRCPRAVPGLPSEAREGVAGAL
jgi:hypothetical protein